MAVALGVVAVGAIAANTAMQVSANRKKRRAEIEAAEKEAQFLEAQARRTEKVKERQLELLELERNEVFGDQVNAIAQNNIDLSGTALQQVVDTQLQFDDEELAIMQESDFDIQLANLRAREHRLGAQRIKKAGKMQDFATILGGVSQVSSYSVSTFAGAGGSSGGTKATSSGSTAAASSSRSPGITSSQVGRPIQ